MDKICPVEIARCALQGEVIEPVCITKTGQDLLDTPE